MFYDDEWRDDARSFHVARHAARVALVESFALQQSPIVDDRRQRHHTASGLVVELLDHEASAARAGLLRFFRRSL